MNDVTYSEAELAASNVVEACVAVRAAGRSDAAVAAAMVALAEHPEIDPSTQEGAHFVVGAAAGYDKGRMNVVAQVTAFLERPECRGRLDLATRLIVEHNHNYELVSSILLNIPRQSALEARMAAASAEPTVSGPAGVPRDPGQSWAAAVAKANEKLH
jgi:hypothetical protein